jgi:hypothetical protein
MSKANLALSGNEDLVVSNGDTVFFYCYQIFDGTGVLDGCDSITRTDYKVVAHNETHLVINSKRFETLQYAGEGTGNLKLESGWSTTYKNDHLRGNGLMFLVYTTKEQTNLDIERMIEDTIFIDRSFDYDLSTAKQLYETV